MIFWKNHALPPKAYSWRWVGAGPRTATSDNPERQGATRNLGSSPGFSFRTPRMQANAVYLTPKKEELLIPTGVLLRGTTLHIDEARCGI